MVNFNAMRWCKFCPLDSSLRTMHSKDNRCYPNRRTEILKARVYLAGWWRVSLFVFFFLLHSLPCAVRVQNLPGLHDTIDQVECTKTDSTFEAQSECSWKYLPCTFYWFHNWELQWPTPLSMIWPTENHILKNRFVRVCADAFIHTHRFSSV